MFRPRFLPVCLTWATILIWPAAMSVVAGAQAPDAPAPAASAPGDPFRFTSPAALMMWTVKADQTESVELVWSVIGGRLAESANPELRALGSSLRVYKAVAPPDAKEATYFVVANPASTLSYSMNPFLLFESGLFERPEAEEIYKLLQESVLAVEPIPMSVLP